MPTRFGTLVGKRVLLTGHTGFTGSWAALWLERIGASVIGVALPPETHPSLYEELRLSALESHICDVRDLERLCRIVSDAKPDLVLHLAAQPLVRRSYREPVETFATNCMGTAHVLEACRRNDSVRAVVCVTTDKVYESKEWLYRYRENDPLGGKDPYSASKAAAELVAAAYRASFFSAPGSPGVATARGGNIIGGGDWSEDRLVPDFVRAVLGGTRLRLRFPGAIRPWQHVLALIDGYFTLLERLLVDPGRYGTAWNLGPADHVAMTVREVLDELAANWRRPQFDQDDAPLPEAGVLQLDSACAMNALGWRPVWNTRDAVAATAHWYRAFHRDARSARELCLAQIEAWEAGRAPE